ncbi:MAG: C_GCAxxG_C_C family protein [Clostridia bacterium]|nr:C_GCAxxG_C_C family protein [Clostridia bacterium]
MKLSEYARFYYIEKHQNCAVSILLGASDKYSFGLCEEDAKLVVGFGGGMGCGKVCGALSGSIAVLGKLFCDRRDFRAICAGFVKIFKEAYGCDSIDCAVLTAKYKNAERRCVDVVILAADILEEYIEEIKNKEA